MRDVIKIYVCPDLDCPAIGKQHRICPKHGKRLVGQVYERRVPTGDDGLMGDLLALVREFVGGGSGSRHRAGKGR